MTLSNIRIIQGTEIPLSADVIICPGKEKTWVYDVGRSDSALEELQEMIRKNIIISHFHPDHMDNLRRLDFENLYVGKNTFKYTGQGIIVQEPMELEDKLWVIPFPSSHAKGSLALKLANDCILVGDGLYPQYKGNNRVFNVQHLREQIDLLESMDVKLVGLSHRQQFFQEKKGILAYLKSIYDRRDKNAAFIRVDE